MPTSAVLRRRMDEWERQHGHSVETVYLSLTYGNALDPSLPTLSRADIEGGAELWLDYQRKLGDEEHTRRIGESDRAELLGGDIRRHTEESD